MQVWDKGGIRVMADGATLGPAMMRMGHLGPENSLTVEPSVDQPMSSPIIVVDLQPVWTALDRLTEEVHTLRAELAERSAASRWKRLKSAVQTWWVGVRYGR